MAQLPDPVENLDSFGKELYARMVKVRGRIDGMYRTLLNHPRLVEKISDLGAFLRFQGSLPGDVRECAILLTSHALGAEYEWIKHQGPASACGLPGEVVEAIFSGSETLPREYKAIAEIVHLILRTKESIPQGLQDELIARYGKEGLIELVILPGFYTCIANVLFAFDIPLPPQETPLSL